MEKIFYRIKNITTGLYYTGKVKVLKNPNYDKTKIFIRNPYSAWADTSNVTHKEALKYPLFYQKQGKGILESYVTHVTDVNQVPPWIEYYRVNWDNIGMLYESKKGAELVMSRLTGTTKHLRANKVDFLLNAPKEAANFQLIPCKMEIINL